jgi:hypothetical protein
MPLKHLVSTEALASEGYRVVLTLILVRFLGHVFVKKQEAMVIKSVLSIISVYQPVIEENYSILPVFACLSILYINLITFYLFDSIII